MKKEELFEAINDIDDREIEKAGSYEKPGRRAFWTRWGTVAACLIVLAAAVAAGKLQGTGGSLQPGVKVVSAKPVEEVASGMDPAVFLDSQEHWDWWEPYWEKMQKSAQHKDDMCGYYTSMMETILADDDENTVCSPLNIYLAMSMLAEVSDGNTRAQILDLLEVPDIGTLRIRVNDLMQSNQLNTPAVKSLLANSLWLNDSVSYNEETLQRLSDTYYTSTYSGKPGSEELDRAFREWLDSNTGGLLKEYTKDQKLDPETVMALASTLYFRAAWQDEFVKKETDQGIFHGVKGDTEVQMMHRTGSDNLYWTDRFISIALPMQDGCGSMFFYLPQEGVDVNSLLSDPDLFKAMKYGEDENWYYRIVNLSVPKFKVTEKTDLLETLRELGITDAMDGSLADFSPLTAGKPVWLGGAEHAATVEIDEEGVTGAAYTELELSGSSMPPEEIVDLTLDRPFLFVITARDGSLLFSGVVRNVE